jgi:hypothetical protein
MTLISCDICNKVVRDTKVKKNSHAENVCGDCRDEELGTMIRQSLEAEYGEGEIKVGTISHESEMYRKIIRLYGEWIDEYRKD